jgi:hypothetical protein
MVQNATQQQPAQYTLADYERVLIQGGTAETAQRVGHKRRLTSQGAGENSYKQFDLLVYDIEYMGPNRLSETGQQFTLLCYGTRKAGISREFLLWAATYDSLASLFREQPFDPRAFKLE